MSRAGLGWGLYRALWAADRAARWQRIAAADERRCNQRRRRGDVQYGRRSDDFPQQLRPLHNSWSVHLFWLFVLAALVFGLSWVVGLEVGPAHFGR